MALALLGTSSQNASISGAVGTSTTGLTRSGSDNGAIGIICYTRGTSRTLSSCTYDGVAGTIVSDTFVDGGQSVGVALVSWPQTDLPSTTGSYSLVSTYSGNVTNVYQAILSFSGVDQTTLVTGVQETTATNSTSLPVNITNTRTGDKDLYCVSVLASGDATNADNPPAHTVPSQLSSLYTIATGFSDLGVSAASTSAVIDNTEPYTWAVQHATAATQIDSILNKTFIVNEASVSPVLTADTGTFVLTNTDATLSVNRPLVADTASFILTGQDVLLSKTRILDATTSSYLLTGQNAGLVESKKIIADTASFILTGQDATIAKSFSISVTTVSFSLTGQDVGLNHGKRLIADSQTYSFNGSDILLIRGDTNLPADSGTFIFSFTDVDLLEPVRIGVIDGDNTIFTGQTNIVLSGTGFLSTQGSGGLAINNADQDIVSWSETTIIFNHVLGDEKHGANTATVINSVGSSADKAITEVTAAGSSYVDLVDVSNSDIITIPSLSIGDQLEYVNTTTPSGLPVSVDSSGIITITGDPEGESFQARANDGTGWGAFGTQFASVQLSLESGTFTLIGQDTSLLVSTVINADSATFTLNVQDANLLLGLGLSASSASFILLGQPLDLNLSTGLIVTSGTFSVLGQDIRFLINQTLVADSQSYIFTGQDASLDVSSSISTTSGSFTLVGQDVTFRHAQRVSADSGTFILEGQSVGLVLQNQFVIPLDSGIFILTGQDVILATIKTLVVQNASFILTGQSVILKVSRTLLAQKGPFFLTGNSANLKFSGDIIFTDLDGPISLQSITPKIQVSSLRRIL